MYSECVEKFQFTHEVVAIQTVHVKLQNYDIFK